MYSSINNGILLVISGRIVWYVLRGSFHILCTYLYYRLSTLFCNNHRHRSRQDRTVDAADLWLRHRARGKWTRTVLTGSLARSKTCPFPFMRVCRVPASCLTTTRPRHASRIGSLSLVLTLTCLSRGIVNVLVDLHGSSIYPPCDR